MEAYTHIYGKWVGKGGQDEHRMGCILNKNSRWDHEKCVDEMGILTYMGNGPKMG